MSMYVVIENGLPYPHLYTSYASAAAAAQEKYKQVIEEQIEEANGYPICSEIDVPEHTSGTTYLYVEKGIHIYIYKLEVKV